jgi:quercetin dioxygenase-like cupin family protein
MGIQTEPSRSLAERRPFGLRLPAPPAAARVLGRIRVDYRQPMDGFIIDRSDGRDDGEDWTENYEELPGSANISIILESTTKAGVGPRLHKHPYAETFLIRRGWATFTIGSTELQGRAGQVLVVPANTPHKFSTGPDGYEAMHIHANPRFVTEWLE